MKDGILIVDKPEGMSSAQLVAGIKRWTGAKKAGHAGTLDPFATGVMIICINQATRLADFFLKGEKKYTGTLRLGIDTDTQDAEGRITETHTVHTLDMERIKAAMAMFVGDIMQAPPVFSALKHKGKRLYQLARRGKPVQKPPRPVTIYQFRLLDVSLPDIGFAVHCSSGTYIRTLCADLGKALGTGGHLTVLRRIASGGFTDTDAVSLKEIRRTAESGQAVQLIDMESAVPWMRRTYADAELEGKLKFGEILTTKDITFDKKLKIGEPVKIIGKKRQLLAIVCLDATGNEYRYCRNFAGTQ